MAYFGVRLMRSNESEEGEYECSHKEEIAFANAEDGVIVVEVIADGVLIG